MSQRNLVIITKIILFYSLFVVVMKGIFLFQQNLQISNAQQEEWFLALALAQLVLMLPFLALAIAAFFINKRKQYSLVFVLIGAVVIIGLRIFESQLLEHLMQIFH